MADKKTMWVIVFIVILTVLVVLFILSLKGYIPLTYKEAETLKGLMEFLDSPRDDMRNIKVNAHLVEIGKRRSLQILPGYRGVLYQVRPYRQIQYKPRNMTRAEIVDMCINIAGPDLDTLKAEAATGRITPAWKGRVSGSPVQIYRATMFTYVVSGLTEKPIFIAQVELAKRLGMPDDEILSRIIPIQMQWYLGLGSFMDKSFPYTYMPNYPDILIVWMNEKTGG